MKQQLSLIIKKLFLQIGVYGLIRKISPNQNISILRYHAIVSPEDNFYTSPPIALSAVEFEAHVRYFAKYYTVLSLDEAVDIVRSGQTPPPNSVVFTFDDGYLDNLEAARLLNKYGANGTFYVVTEVMGRKTRFWLAEVTYLILKTGKPELSITAADETFHFTLSDTSSRWKAIRTGATDQIEQSRRSRCGDIATGRAAWQRSVAAGSYRFDARLVASKANA